MTFHDFHDLSMTKKRKSVTYRQSTQHIFPNKLYTTYESIIELVVTVAAAHRTIVKKRKLLVYLHIFTTISQQSVQHDFIR